MEYPIGKIPPSLLSSRLRANARHVKKDRSIVVGPTLGEDAAVIDNGGTHLLVTASDPVTFTTERIGAYAVHVNANDIAAMGAVPRWFLATVLLPEKGATPKLFTRIFNDITKACGVLGITLVGGHSEVTYDLRRPLVAGHMLGEVPRGKLIRTSGAREGDRILLTKAMGIEGTAILAREKSTLLVSAIGLRAVARAKHLLDNPGISIVPDARLAIASGGVHCLHDPTEGGVANALYEISEAARVGLEIEGAALPILPETQAICRYLNIDPRGLLASGALLLTARESAVGPIRERLARAKIPVAVIGRVVKARRGVRVWENGKRSRWPRFARDEITRVLK